MIITKLNKLYLTDSHFLLIDKVVEYEEGQRCVAIKQVSGNEPFFQGHFPEYAVMPGVLITEALARSRCGSYFK